MTTLIACAICHETPDLLHRLDHMTVCTACKALVEQEADRRLAAMVEAMRDMHREESAA